MELNASQTSYQGISLELLLSSVKNTAPFIFENDSDREFVRILRGCEKSRSVSLSDYFLVCIAAHFTTVATFVPTDLDQTIRLKLWRWALPEQIEEMIDHVERFLSWDDAVVSTRRVTSPDGHFITGHYGEWFTLAVAAYCSAKRLGMSAEISLREKIVDLIREHERAMTNLVKSESWRDLFTASALLAHNLGDLDRSFDLWNVPDDDILKSEIYKLGHSPRKSYRSLYIGGEVNKKFTAAESHRHFALRKPKCLRRSSDFLLGMGPFYDLWGARLSRHPGLSLEELAEVAEALIDGWERLNRTQPVYGYARALYGFLSHSRGIEAIESLPSSRKKLLRAGNLSQMLAVSTHVFEGSWTARLQKHIRQVW